LLISGIKSSPVLDCIKVAINGENHLVLNSILSTLAEAKINIWFEVQVKNKTDLMGITLCVDPHETEKGITLIKENHPDLNVCSLQSVSILSAFPYRENPEIAFLFLKALEEESIPIIAVSTSLSSIACLVRHEERSLAIESLRKAFGLQK
jgi:aspartokinase